MIYISLPYATFLLVVEDNKIVLAPPIAKWAIGKNPETVMNYYESKGAKILCAGSLTG